MLQGTGTPGAVLPEVGARVPDEAKPAIERSRREARQGQTHALDALEGAPRHGALDTRRSGA